MEVGEKMNVRHLEIFVKVAKTKSMSETARQLYMTQPAISQTISELENELNTKLFDRIKQKLVLTDAGDVLYAYSRKVLSLLDEAKVTIDNLNHLKEGKLHIGASTTIGIYLLPKIISSFKKKYERIDVHFTINNTKVIEDMVTSHLFDVGIVEGEIHSDDLHSIELLHDELYLVCSSKHDWVKAKNIQTIELTDVIKEPIILREKGSGTREIVEREFLKQNVPLKSSHELNNTEAIKKAVEENIGVAFISKIAVEEELKTGQLKKINVNNCKFTRSFNLIYHKDKYQSPLFKAFLTFLGV